MEYLYIIKEFVMEYIAEFIIFLYIGFLILLISMFVFNYKHRKLLKKYNNLVRSFKGGNFEELIIHLQDHVNDLNANVNILKLETKELDTRLESCIQSVGFIRYDAFGDIASEMSYSVAFLDGFKNGVVITGIYGRNQTVTYAKDVKNGISNRSLSAEEIIALDRALKGRVETV